MVSKRQVDTDIRRRNPRRHPKERILIVCEGRVTEKEYFQAFKLHARNQRVHVEIAKETGGIHLAISNPCFELWALLHFQDQRAHLEREQAGKALRKHLPKYDKKLDFVRMHPGYEAACARGKDLDTEAERHDAAHRNPTTGVYRLTEAIRTS